MPFPYEVCGYDTPAQQEISSILEKLKEEEREKLPKVGSEKAEQEWEASPKSPIEQLVWQVDVASATNTNFFVMGPSKHQLNVDLVKGIALRFKWNIKICKDNRTGTFRVICAKEDVHYLSDLLVKSLGLETIATLTP